MFRVYVHLFQHEFSGEDGVNDKLFQMNGYSSEECNLVTCVCLRFDQIFGSLYTMCPHDDACKRKSTNSDLIITPHHLNTTS